MVIKTELCAFSEWKIYPGRGIRYVAKDGRPFLFLSKRTKDFSLRYLPLYPESSKLKDSDGLLLGDVFIKNSNKLRLERTKEIKSSESKEPLKVLLLMK
jgi:ribosomal protein L24E